MSDFNLIDNQTLDTSMSSAHKLLSFMTDASSKIRTILDDQQTQNERNHTNGNWVDFKKSKAQITQKQIHITNSPYQQNLTSGKSIHDFYPTPPSTPSSKSSSPLSISLMEEDPFPPTFTQSPDVCKYTQQDTRAYSTNTRRYSPLNTCNFTQHDNNSRNTRSYSSSDTCRFSQQQNTQAPDTHIFSRKRASNSLSFQEQSFKYRKSEDNNNNIFASYLIPCQDNGAILQAANHYVTSTNQWHNSSNISLLNNNIKSENLSTIPSFEIDDISDALVLKEVIPIAELRKYLI